MYDSVAKIHCVLSKPELEVKLDKVFDDLAIKRFTLQQKVFIAEYVEVFSLLCRGLVILQGDKYIGFGYLLPTLTVMKGQLPEMIDQHNRPVTVCESLV